MEIVLLGIRLCLFSIFALAGIGKLMDLNGSKKAVEGFGVPTVLAKPLGVLLPVVEIAIAILLLPVQTAWFGAIAGGVLMLIFVGGMLWQMKLGNAPDCHCFGQIHSEPVSKKSLIRNAVFVLLAGILVVSGKGNQGSGIFDSSNSSADLDIMQIILGIAVIGFLAAIVFFLKKISEQQTQIMRRIEVLELISHEGGKEVERDDVTDPGKGLPIGAPVPTFELPNINNEKIAFKSLLKTGNSTLLFFVSPSCSPCEALLPDIEEWQAKFREKINFVFISSGKAKENLDKFAGDSFKQILLQKDNEISELFGAEWTPTALFINSDGAIASRVAAGDSAIRELMELVEAEAFEKDNDFILNGEGKDSKLGTDAPEFALNDLKGEEISEAYFKEQKTIVTYWGTKCPHCVNMLEELREWDKSKGVDDPNLLVISSGEIEDHDEMELNSPVVIDNEHEVGPGLGMQGTPSAILIGKDGKIASEVAVGADGIWSLLGKQK